MLKKQKTRKRFFSHVVADLVFLQTLAALEAYGMTPAKNEKATDLWEAIERFVRDSGKNNVIYF